MVRLTCTNENCRKGAANTPWVSEDLEQALAMEMLRMHRQDSHSGGQTTSFPTLAPAPVPIPTPVPARSPEPPPTSSEHSPTGAIKKPRLSKNINDNGCIVHHLVESINQLIRNRENILDRRQREEILSKTLKVTVQPGVEQNMNLSDIANDFKSKYPNWDSNKIEIPSYEFPGVRENIIWTEEDIIIHATEKYSKLKKWCDGVIRTGDKESIKNQFQKRFFQSYKKKEFEKLMTEFEGMNIEDISKHCNGFIEKLIKSEDPKAFSALGYILGKKAELKCKENNSKYLCNKTGLILTGLSNFKHLGTMLDKLGVNLKQIVKSSKEVESDLIRILPASEKILIKFEEVKALLPKDWYHDIKVIEDDDVIAEWYHVNEAKDDTEKIANRVIAAFEQLEKDIQVFKSIFGFLSKSEWKRLEISFICSLPFSCIPDSIQICEECAVHIKSKTDFDEEEIYFQSNVQTAMKRPKPEILDIYSKLLAIYIGVGSMIELKTVGEGYMKEKEDLKDVQNKMFNYPLLKSVKNKIVMLGKEQMKLNYSNLQNIEKGCVVFGPYGSGKTDSLVFQYEKILDLINEEVGNYQIYILIWDEKAKDLKPFFSNIVDARPKKLNTEVHVLKKSTAMSNHGLDESDFEDKSTTDQLNILCEQIEKQGKKFSKIYVLVDEVGITNHEETLIGNGPFQNSDQIYEWGKLNPPSKIFLMVAVTPESENFLDRNKYNPLCEEALENKQINKLPTFILPRVFRSTRKVKANL